MRLLEILKSKFSEIYIEIRGRETVFLEGYTRIEEYTETKIVLKSPADRICVTGVGLRLRHINSERVAVDGRINGVEFL